MGRHIPILDTHSFSDYRKEGILVGRFAEYLEKHKNLVFPHRHNFYQLVIFNKASGSFSIDFSHFEMREWRAYFMIPGQVHTWAFGNEVDGYVVNFSVDFFQSFLLRPDYLTGFSFCSGHAPDGVIDIPLQDRTAISVACEELIKLNESIGNINLDSMRVLLLYVLLQLDNYTQPKQYSAVPTYNYTILRNFQQLVEKHYAKVRLPKHYAEMLFITPNHLNSLCKEFLGVQAGEVIRNRVLLEAKRLLVIRALSINEIALELNFNDNSYFTKFFKKSTGVTPEEFRKQTFN